jgi:predicted DNA-binding protein (UPF0251 family)
MHHYFKPQGIPTILLEEETLKLEELEALRLKDLEGMHQADCAEAMRVSRQTFQLILEEARVKVARALIEGRAIKIEGGDYEIKGCLYSCESCGATFEVGLVQDEKACIACGSDQIICRKKKRHRRHQEHAETD